MSEESKPDAGTGLAGAICLPLNAKNEILRVNNHAEIIIGKQRALVELEDLKLVECLRWSAHPRGPITVRLVSVNPRLRKYKLMSMIIYGKPVSFIDGNHYDLRRPNIADRQLRLASCTRKGINGGIFFRKGNWKAQAKWRGETLVRSFSVNKYGKKAALLMARDARRMMVEMGIEEARKRIVELRKLPRLRRENEIKNAPIPEGMALEGLAKLYAEREHLPDSMIPHLHRMLLLGGGRMPKLVNRKDLAPVNLYAGNQEYENCVIEIERDKDTGEIKGFQPYLRLQRCQRPK